MLRYTQITTNKKRYNLPRKNKDLVWRLTCPNNLPWINFSEKTFINFLVIIQRCVHDIRFGSFAKQCITIQTIEVWNSLECNHASTLYSLGELLGCFHHWVDCSVLEQDFKNHYLPYLQMKHVTMRLTSLLLKRSSIVDN